MPESKLCGSCRHWMSGECHAFPPSASEGGRGVWPMTLETDTCSKWSGSALEAPKKSRAPDEAVVNLIREYEAPVSRRELISDIQMNFDLSRSAAVSRVNVMERGGLIVLSDGLVRLPSAAVPTPELDVVALVAANPGSSVRQLSALAESVSKTTLHRRLQEAEAAGHIRREGTGYEVVESTEV